MTTNYYLQDKNTDSETNILLYVRYNGLRFKYSPRIKVKRHQWNPAKQFIYAGVKDTTKLNNRLKLLKTLVETEYNSQIEKGIIPETAYLKAFLNEKFLGKKSQTSKESQKTFYDNFNELIQYKKKFLEDSTIKKYNTLLKHLKQIEKQNNNKLNINAFNKTFYQTFVDYFIGLGQLNNTIKDKQIKTMNAALNWFVEMEYIKKNEFKGIKFLYKVNPADTVSLNENELHKLYSLDLSNNKKLRQVRDVFCLECYTGLRYSETKKVNKTSYNHKYLTLFTKKTTKGLNIPLRKEARNILDKYFNSDLPLPVISNQKMNDYIKELGAMCEFNEPVTILRISGKVKTEIVKKKHELLTTHTGRRTFVTLSYKKGMKPLDIMNITRHKSYDTFMKYYRLDEIEVHENFFNLYDDLDIKYTAAEIIKNLLIKKVPIKTIAFALGINIDKIEKVVK